MARCAAIAKCRYRRRDSDPLRRHPRHRPAGAASSRRCRKRRRLSSGKCDSAHVVVTTGRASAGTRAKASGITSTASPRSSSGGAVAASAISASSLATRSGWSGHRQARNHRASSASVTSTGSRSTPTRATTSGSARVGMGRSPTIEDDSCTGDDGSPSDCPLLYVMPTRSTLRLSPAEQPTSISPTAFAPARCAASAMAGYSTAQRPVSLARICRRTAMATTEIGHSQQRVDRRA